MTWRSAKKLLEELVWASSFRLKMPFLEANGPIISEVGLDMGRWKTEAHFASWLGLCPDNRISGDKVLARGTRHVLNRAANALHLGASTLLKSQTYLGAQDRRLRSRLGAPKAITAMAHRLARFVYRMLKYGQQYVDKGAGTTNEKTASDKSSSSGRRQPNLAYRFSPRTPDHEVSGVVLVHLSGGLLRLPTSTSTASLVANYSMPGHVDGGSTCFKGNSED